MGKETQMAWDWPSQRIPRVSLMLPAVHAFLSRVSRLFGPLLARAKEVLKLKNNPSNDTFPRQRMCPFCGLITARGKPYCLECGKALKPA